MKKIVIIILFILLTFSASAQTHKIWEAVKRNDDATEIAPNEARKCTSDHFDNFYEVGHFNGTITFGNTTLTAVNGDAYLVKYNKDGEVLWARRAGGTGNELCIDILFFDGAIYITGNFEGTMNFSPFSSSGIAELTSAGNRDGFIAKYSTNGAVNWVKRFGGSGWDWGSGLAGLNDGIYLTGVITSAPANFNTPSSYSSNTLSAPGGDNADMFVAKFDKANGSTQWIKRAGGTDEDYAGSIAIDNNSIYVVGTSRSSLLNFNTPYNTATNSMPNFYSGIYSGYLVKFTTTGDYSWSRRFGDNCETWGTSVIAKDNSVYVAGRYCEDMSFSQNSNTVSFSSPWGSGLQIDEGYIAKYNSSGTLQWGKRSGGTINDITFSDDGLSIYTVGSFIIDGVNFNTPSNYGSNILTVPTSLYPEFYQYAAYFAKYNLDGNYLWSRQNTSETNIPLGDEYGMGITVEGSRIFTVSFARGDMFSQKCFFEGSLSTNPLSSSSYCAGTNISVPFTASGIYDIENTFRVELSDANGDFTRNQNLGTGLSSPITSILPTNTVGTNYKVRVVSTNPKVVGLAIPLFSFNIIAASKGGTVTGGTTVCTGSTTPIPITLSGQTGNILKWQQSSTPDFASPLDINLTTATINVGNMTADRYFRAVVQNSSCASANSIATSFTVSPTTVSGTLSSVNGIFCAGINNNTINLSGKVGNVLKWQSSSSSAFTSPVDINNTSTSLNVTNINTTTYYRAVVKSGACAEVNTGNRQIAISTTAVTLNNSSPLNSVTFPVKSNFTITGQNAITGSSNVLFRSNKSVELKPGFRAESGTVFKAEIGGCN